MDLQEWWKTAKKSPDNPNGYTTISFAKKIRRAQSIASRLIRATHRPDPVTAIRIVIVTEGAVQLDDLYKLPQKYRCQCRKQ